MNRKLERKIREFVKLIDEEITVCFSDDCYYDYADEWVFYAPDRTEDNGFVRHLYEFHNCDLDLCALTWSILHEIGHYYTWDDKYETEDEMWERYCYQHFPCETFEQSKNMQDAYFNMESEWIATEWAIEYAKENFPIVKAFDKIFRKEV